MRPEESIYPDDWLQIARKDFRRAQHMLDDDDPEAAGFFLQQALEKYLKAFLLSNGWALKRIHDLVLLLNNAIAFDPSLESFRALCQRVTDYYMVERYPISLQLGLDSVEVRSSLKQAQSLVDLLEGSLQQS